MKFRVGDKITFPNNNDVFGISKLYPESSYQVADVVCLFTSGIHVLNHIYPQVFIGECKIISKKNASHPLTSIFK